MTPLTTTGQDLATYQWQNRLVLVLTTDPSAPLFQQQLQELRQAGDALQDLRIHTYQLLPQWYAQGVATEAQWQVGNKIYQEYHHVDSDFELILIGLDGGIKLRRHRLVMIDELFDLINTMPMRRAELRQRGGG